MIESSSFSAGGARFHYLAAGAGQPVVLLHGGGSKASHFDDLMERLAARYRVYAYDQRGFGATGCTGQGEISHDRWAKDVVLFLDHVGASKASLVGWSLGATVAMNAASQAADRITGLVLMGAPDPDKPVNQAFFQNRLAMLSQGRPFDEIAAEAVEQAANLFAKASVGRDPRIMERLRAEQIAALPCAMRVVTAYSRRPPLGPIVARVMCPVTLLVGDHDTVCDAAAAQRLQHKLPDASCVLLPDCGHYYALEQPAAVAQAIERAFG